MESTISPPKKLRSPVYDGVNTKTSVTCTNVPESLFDASAAKKHFSKFGRVQKIKLFPKRRMCIIEYDQPLSVQRAVLNAGAYDGFMFDVSRTKPRVRRKSKKEDDPDWLPDSDVEKELMAMGATPSYRISRQKPMDLQSEVDVKKTKPVIGTFKQSPLRKPTLGEKAPAMPQQQSSTDSPIPTSVTQTSLSTIEAAGELHQLRSKVALSPDEQWRLLDARDKILRSWGGAGSRVKVGGATIGTCPDMCPEKERLHRQSEYQVMTLEAIPDSDGQLDPCRAVKQYSRSSADQEMPMCYELRSAPVLMQTCAYLLHEIADTTQQVTLADWFHFMWDRLRGIRKDITQQALCCSESIELVEMCARFHAHCAARLADLEHGQFDQKLNTDNLTKCLQTLKHMYADVTPNQRPREAEFRGYIALLNLGDANFWWEIKQLPREIQKSQDILFAMQVFNTLDNNNYVRFFRLVRDKATYLQACILLRYFNDVRARALARIVKAYAPRGGSKYPAQDLMNALLFESFDHMKSFISHYGLHLGKTDETELTIILDRNQFIEDSNPYPISRAKSLIESKRQCTVGEVIAGGQLQSQNYKNHMLYSSFNKDGTLKERALIAEDQGYNTTNDSNRNIQALKAELQKLSQSGKNIESLKKAINPKDTVNLMKPREPSFPVSTCASDIPKLYSFNPAIPVASAQVIKDSPQRIFGDRSHVFSFSKPQESGVSSVSTGTNSVNIFKSIQGQNKVFEDKNRAPSFSNIPKSGVNLFKKLDTENKNVFSNPNKPLIGFRTSNIGNKNIFSKQPDALDGKHENTIIAGSIFSKPSNPQDDPKVSSNIFSCVQPTFSSFTKSADTNDKFQPIAPNGDVTNCKLSPSSLFKSATNANGPETKNYSIFQTKNPISSVANNIFKSIQTQQSSKVYEFDENSDETKNQLELKLIVEAKMKEELRKEEERKQELKRQEEKRLHEEMQKRQEELKRLEEKRKKEEEEKRRKEEEKKREESRKRLEEEKKAEQRRKAEEERKFKERVEKESVEVTGDLIDLINQEVVKNIMKEEMERFKELMTCADNEIQEILSELCSEICYSEIKAEKIWTENLMKKWFRLWRTQFIRNKRRRNLLDDTPIWLTNDVPVNTAFRFRRLVEKSALLNMNAIHKGYRFTGELKQLPAPEPYNIMEIIKSPLLKRMKQICYPYDKCFFWKVTLVSPGNTKLIYRKIDIEKWLIDSFSDKKEHDISKKILYVQKQSWNNLMNFAISVSLISENSNHDINEAVEGTNGVLFYFNENEFNFTNTIKETLKHKYPYQCIPVAIIMPKMCDESIHRVIEQLLIALVDNKTILAFRFFVVDETNLCDSLNASTKSALKWLAKKFPQNPPLEIDYLKSLCQRCLGNEIWHSLKSLQDNRMSVILKDFQKLIECYNKTIDKLTEIITNEDLFNYPTFPLEFNVYLDNTSPYPKPYEFITHNVKNSVNISNIKDIMKKLKLPAPVSEFHPANVTTMQEHIRSYCKQIGWFENNEEVVCKVIAVMPNELSNLNMPPQEFSHFFEQYDLVDILNIVICEKIKSYNFNNLFVIYDKTVMDKYHSYDWMFDTNILTSIKHKIIENEDDIDLFIETKRRKLALDSMEYLMLEENDQTLVDKSINLTDKSISKYSNCKMAVEKLEEKIEEERKKSLVLENLLKTALLRN